MSLSRLLYGRTTRRDGHLELVAVENLVFIDAAVRPRVWIYRENPDGVVALFNPNVSFKYQRFERLFGSGGVAARTMNGDQKLERSDSLRTVFLRSLPEHSLDQIECCLGVTALEGDPGRAEKACRRRVGALEGLSRFVESSLSPLQLPQPHSTPVPSSTTAASVGVLTTRMRTGLSTMRAELSVHNDDNSDRM